MTVIHRTVVSEVGKAKVIVVMWVNEMQITVNGITATFPAEDVRQDDVLAAFREAVSA